MTALPAFQRLTVAMVAADLCAFTTRQLAVFLSVAGPGRMAGEISVRSLARQLLLSKPVIHRALNSLAAEDLVQRVPFPGDARMIMVEPGPAAADMLARLETIVAAELAR